MWKHTTVIPIPAKFLNDLRPVNLTSLMMKAMERIVKSHITKIAELLMDPLQFAYRADRGVDDQIQIKLKSALIIHKGQLKGTERSTHYTNNRGTNTKNTT